VAGISVYLHWSWFILAAYEFQARAGEYTIRAWSLVEYIAIFAIVLMHEFGHASACRMVGGRADRIVLWPLGGVAYVAPPPRPGALLWSIAAGPLVNLILVPVLFGTSFVANGLGLAKTNPDAAHFLFSLSVMNFVLLIFNVLPIYPLDGGQILQALLWFIVGRARSLMIASVIGLLVGIGIIVPAIISQNIWFAVLAAFGALQSWAGFRRARMLEQLDRIPRHADAVCPSCGLHPLAGDFWLCTKCRTPFDAFTYRAVCPNCSVEHPVTACPACHRSSPIQDWFPTNDPRIGLNPPKEYTDDAHAG
jgi:Zn-dependent protease